MNNPVVLTNWRRFPRARLNCEVVYGDRFQSWRSHTRDISLGGCRVAGYYPFPVGKTLALKITHPVNPEPVAMVGRVVQLYGGAENALGLVFDRDGRSRSKFEEWMRKVIASDPAAERTMARMPGKLPIEAQLRRSTSKPTRGLSAGEVAVLKKLDRAGRPVLLEELRKDWGADWERRAQVLFDLIADGIIVYTLPPARQNSSTSDEPFVIKSEVSTSKKLREQLESEYGPLGRSFAQQLENVTREVIGVDSSGRTRAKPSTSTHSGANEDVGISWVSVPTKRR